MCWEIVQHLRGETPRMASTLKTKRRYLWLAGVFFLVVGFIVAALVLPTLEPDPVDELPDLQLPRLLCRKA